MSQTPLKADVTVQETALSLTVAGTLDLAGVHTSVWRCCANRAIHITARRATTDADVTDMFMPTNVEFFLDVAPGDTVSVILATGETEIASSLWATKQSGGS